MSPRATAALAPILALALGGCGDNLAPEIPIIEPPASCTTGAPGILAPLWIAGMSGPSDELGFFGKPDAVVVDPSGLLLAGDEDPDYQELHVYDLQSDDPTQTSDSLTPILDLGTAADEFDFQSMSGLTRDPRSGRIYVAEQGRGQIRILEPIQPLTAPYYQHAGFIGAAAADPGAPKDGEFVRLQAARVDRLGRLFASDDARGQIDSSRRDIQIFSPEGAFLSKIGDSSYGPSPGQDGRLGEPENFVIDQVANRLIVCDEMTRELVVYRYSDGEYLRRIGGFVGIPNGIDIDTFGFLYVVDEGNKDESWIRILDPESGDERYRFAARSEADDLEPGTLNSPDTLVIDTALDLLVVADQGHDRIQGFSLSEIQARACIASSRLTAPAQVAEGRSIPLRLQLFGPEGRADRSKLRGSATLEAFDLATGAPVPVSPQVMAVYAGVGTAVVSATDPGSIRIVASVGGQQAEVSVERPSQLSPQALTGAVSQQDFAGDHGQFVLSGDVRIPSGSLVRIPAGAILVAEPGATLTVEGSVYFEGTADQPILLSSEDADQLWGQIRILGGEMQTDWTFVIAGGDVTREGHCCGAVIHASDSRLQLRNLVVTGSPNKGLLADSGSVVTIHRSVFSHLGMGIEISESTFAMSGSHLFELRGQDDNDALYVRGLEPAQVEDSVLAGVDDDIIDTLNADLRVDGCLLYGAADKGISFDAGDPTVKNSLIADTALAVAIKNIRSASSSVLIEDSTLADASDACLTVFQADDAVVRLTVRSSVVFGCGQTIATEYDPSNLSFVDSVMQDLPDGVSAVGTSEADPVFLNPPTDYRIHPLSPARSGDNHLSGWNP